MKVSPSRFAITAALLVALGASAADAVTFNPTFQIPIGLHTLLTLPGFAGAYCAGLASASLGLGHTINSDRMEFALSLPFNFLVYWLLFRIITSLIMFVFPAKHPAATKNLKANASGEEFDGQTQ